MSLVPCSPPSICDISVLFVSSVCSLSTLLWSRAVHENPRSKQTWKNCMMASPIPISFTYTHCDTDKYDKLPINATLGPIRIALMLAEFHQVSMACTTCQRSARLLASQRMFCLTRPGGWMTATIHLPKCTPHPSSWHVSSRSHMAFRVCHSLILFARLQDCKIGPILRTPNGDHCVLYVLCEHS